MTIDSRSDYGSDLVPAGVTNLLGARPGTAAMHGYDGLMHEDMTQLFFVFETTHEALQKLIVPPPLEVDRDKPALCTVMAFTSPHFRGRDGRKDPYTGFTFFAHTKFQEFTGPSGWEFVDGPAPLHDKTCAEKLVLTGQIFGMLKKIADIRFYRNGLEVVGDLSTLEEGDDVEVTVDRKGRRIASLRVRIGAELPRGSTDSATADAPFAGTVAPGRILAVREFPTVDYKGYVDRSVVATFDLSGRPAPKHLWTAQPVSLEFWESESEALDLLKVSRLVGAAVAVVDSAKEGTSMMEVVANLPLDISKN